MRSLTAMHIRLPFAAPWVLALLLAACASAQDDAERDYAAFAWLAFESETAVFTGE